jgi:hypothetical protein
MCRDPERSFSKFKNNQTGGGILGKPKVPHKKRLYPPPFPEKMNFKTNNEK